MVFWNQVVAQHTMPGKTFLASSSLEKAKDDHNPGQQTASTDIRALYGQETSEPRRRISKPTGSDDRALRVGMNASNVMLKGRQHLQSETSNAPKWLLYGAMVLAMLGWCLGVGVLAPRKGEKDEEVGLCETAKLDSVGGDRFHSGGCGDFHI